MNIYNSFICILAPVVFVAVRYFVKDYSEKKLMIQDLCYIGIAFIAGLFMSYATLPMIVGLYLLDLVILYLSKISLNKSWFIRLASFGITIVFALFIQKPYPLQMLFWWFGLYRFILNSPNHQYL